MSSQCSLCGSREDGLIQDPGRAIERYENSFLHIKSCLKDYNNDMDRATHAKRFAINALDDIFIVKKEN